MRLGYFIAREVLGKKRYLAMELFNHVRNAVEEGSSG
jgi:hypothetical protein